MAHKMTNSYISKFIKVLNASRKSLQVERSKLIKTRLMNRHLPPWFIPMLNDSLRNNFYEKIIKKHAKNKTVLEIGAGVGLLSIMAAKHGAKHVYACELNPLMYYLAKENIENGPYKEKITLFFMHSDSLKLGEHIPEKVDIILSELISSDIFSENMAPTLINAKKLLKDDGIFIPSEIEVFGCLIELQTTLPYIINSKEPLFKLIKDFTQDKSIYLDLNLFPFKPISKPIKLFSLKDGYAANPEIPLSFEILKNKKNSSKNTFFCVYFSLNDGKDKLLNLDIEQKRNNCHWENIVWELDNKKNTYHLKLINKNERLFILD